MKRESVVLTIAFLMFVAVSSPMRAQVSFFQPPTYAGLGNVFVADFNGDGKQDILTSDGTMNLGNGDGTFKMGTAVSGTVLAVADFNGDGKPDVLEQGTGTLLVLLGKGDGTFQAPISTASGANLLTVAATDLNGDHKVDVVGVSASSLLVYISNGDGTFAPAVSYNPVFVNPYIPPGLSFGDFNGDGKTDVLISTIAYTLPSQEVVFLGNGDGSFQTTPKTSAGIPGNSLPALFVAVGDFNGDGKLDVALACGFQDNCSGPTYLLLGNGDGTFQAPVVAFSDGGGLAAADVNGDGKLDLVVNAGAAVVYLGNGDGTFSRAADYLLSLSTNGAPWSFNIAMADFNGDGKPDFAAANAVLLGNGNGTLQGIGLSVPPVYENYSAVGYFEKNGAPDVAAVGYDGALPANLFIFHNNGSGLLSLIHTYTLQQQQVTQIVTADFNGDGNLDLVVFINPDSSSGYQWGYIVLLGNGDGSFQAPIFYPLSGEGSLTFSTDASSYVVADFNNDHNLDIVFAAGNGTSTNSLGVLLGNGDGTFAAPVFYYDDGFTVLMTADFNGDGKPDLAASGVDQSTETRESAILFGNGDGTFNAAVFPASLQGFQAHFTTDLNNDGKPDLISSVFTNGAIHSQVALGNGDGTFALLPALQYQVIAVGDFNGDGIQAVLGDSYSNLGVLQQTGVLLGNGDGTFGSFINILNNGAISPGNTSIQIADMNGDSRPDVVFPYPYYEGIAVLLNTTPIVPNFTISTASGSPTSQAISAGQTASFSLALAGTGSFTGTVNLTCAITPTVTPAPTCTLSSSSVQLSGSGAQSVTVKVGTTASVTTSAVPTIGLPPGAMPLTWTVMLLGSSWVLVRNRKRWSALAASMVVLTVLTCVSCGGSGSSSSHTTPGTPTGNYAVTITASSGSVSHNMALQVIVQ